MLGLTSAGSIQSLVRQAQIVMPLIGKLKATTTADALTRLMQMYQKKSVNMVCTAVPKLWLLAAAHLPSKVRRNNIAL
jgi:hypothetical protein